MSLLLRWMESLSTDIQISDCCSRKVSPKSTCVTCLEHCGRQALSLNQNKVVVDSSLCNSCGECTLVCPVSAIVGALPKRKFMNGLLIYDPNFYPTVKELLIYCKKGIKGVSVPNGWQDERWGKVLEEVNEILNQLGRQPVQLNIQINTIEPVISRRELFISVIKKGQYLAKELTPASWRMSSNPWLLFNYFPDMQFYQLKLQLEKCKVCRACFSLCSQNVFTITDFEVIIDHQKCTNCRLCSDVCPEDAIKVIEKIGEACSSHYPFVVGKCVRCNKSYNSFSGIESGHCHVCANMKNGWLMP